MGIVLITLSVLAFVIIERLNGPQTDSPSLFVRVFEGGYCLLLLFTYIACMSLNYRFERRAQFEEQMELEPENALNYNQYAWIVCRTEGDYEKALECSKI